MKVKTPVIHQVTVPLPTYSVLLLAGQILRKVPAWFGDVDAERVTRIELTARGLIVEWAER